MLTRAEVPFEDGDVVKINLFDKPRILFGKRRIFVGSNQSDSQCMSITYDEHKIEALVKYLKQLKALDDIKHNQLKLYDGIDQYTENEFEDLEEEEGDRILD